MTRLACAYADRLAALDGLLLFLEHSIISDSM